MKEILDQASLRTLARYLKNWQNGVRILTRLDQRIIRNYLRNRSFTALQIGTGPNQINDWLNSDLYPRDNVIKLDATRRFPFENNVFDRIHSEHMIEHIPWRGGMKMLGECHRILKPGGRIRIVTPDLDRLVAATRPGIGAVERERMEYYHKRHFMDAGVPGGCWMMNSFMRMWGHQFIYDEPTLVATLHLAGFQSIIRLSVGESADTAFHKIENESRMPPGYLEKESIVIEASK